MYRTLQTLSRSSSDADRVGRGSRFTCVNANKCFKQHCRCYHICIPPCGDRGYQWIEKPADDAKDRPMWLESLQRGQPLDLPDAARLMSSIVVHCVDTLQPYVVLSGILSSSGSDRRSGHSTTEGRGLPCSHNIEDREHYFSETCMYQSVADQ